MRCRQITLDSDATVIELHKREAKRTCKKNPGYVPMVGHLSESKQVAAVEFRTGNVLTSENQVRFDKRCQAASPSGVYLYRAIATNLNEQGWSCSEVVNLYNRCVECSEN